MALVPCHLSGHHPTRKRAHEQGGEDATCGQPPCMCCCTRSGITLSPLYWQVLNQVAGALFSTGRLDEAHDTFIEVGARACATPTPLPPRVQWYSTSSTAHHCQWLHRRPSDARIPRRSVCATSRVWELRITCRASWTRWVGLYPVDLRSA